eukprot:1456332-Pyramimonas_sp.AAC.1
MQALAAAPCSNLTEFDQCQHQDPTACPTTHHTDGLPPVFYLCACHVCRPGCVPLQATGSARTAEVFTGRCSASEMTEFFTRPLRRPTLVAFVRLLLKVLLVA